MIVKSDFGAKELIKIPDCFSISNSRMCNSATKYYIAWYFFCTKDDRTVITIIRDTLLKGVIIYSIFG